MEVFLRVLNKYRTLEKLPTVFETGDKLHKQEVNAIEAIGLDPGKNVSSLAQTLGVTKGTISPLVSRLSQKGFVKKFKGGDNDKEVLLDLTMQGKRIFHEHEMLRLKLHADLFEQYEKENPQYLSFLKRFLTQAERLIEEHYEETQGN
ncbi:MAG: winged helix-turn-helix transcriptional regulator [Desulfatibacillum sp.]|nr:winged helix-turn-helix transcriptional regulator [Desulfatibacillum sp.]